MPGQNTQLTSAFEYDTSRICFSKAIVGSIPNSVPKISYKRINISTRNQDGSVGDLILEGLDWFSFGVSENKEQGTEITNGYSMPICLFNKDGVSDFEKEWKQTFDNIVEACKDYLLRDEVKEEIGKFDLERSDLKKLNPLYFKKDEKGKVLDNVGPTLYAKLIQSKKHNRILTMLYDRNGNDVDAMSLIGKYCYVKPAIKIESIFIGSKISLQIKLYESEVNILETSMKRLLRNVPPTNVRDSNVTVSNSSCPMLDDDEEKEETKEGSLKGSDDEEAPAPLLAEKPKKLVKVVKKVVKKTA
jgi:hypothetical protein